VLLATSDIRVANNSCNLGKMYVDRIYKITINNKKEYESIFTKKNGSN
jgi:hypothetical protein